MIEVVADSNLKIILNVNVLNPKMVNSKHIFSNSFCSINRTANFVHSKMVFANMNINGEINFNNRDGAKLTWIWEMDKRIVNFDDVNILDKIVNPKTIWEEIEQVIHSSFGNDNPKSSGSLDYRHIKNIGIEGVRTSICWDISNGNIFCDRTFKLSVRHR